MARKKQIDEAALLKIIEEGAPQADVMETFGFKTSTQLKVAYANALMNAGKVPELKGKQKAGKAMSTIVSVNSRGSLIIPKALVSHFGLKDGDHFDVSRSKAGLSLKSVDAPPKTKLRKAGS